MSANETKINNLKYVTTDYLANRWNIDKSMLHEWLKSGKLHSTYIADKLIIFNEQWEWFEEYELPSLLSALEIKASTSKIKISSKYS